VTKLNSAQFSTVVKPLSSMPGIYAGLQHTAVYASWGMLHCPCKTRFRLAGLYREGVESSGSQSKVSELYISFPFLGFIVTLTVLDPDLKQTHLAASARTLASRKICDGTPDPAADIDLRDAAIASASMQHLILREVLSHAGERDFARRSSSVIALLNSTV
jgi:hypothetical protein